MIAFLRFLLDVILACVAPRAILVAENLLLRQQVIVVRRQVKRPHLRRLDRWLLAAVAGRFRALLDAVLIVKSSPRRSSALAPSRMASALALAFPPSRGPTSRRR